MDKLDSFPKLLGSQDLSIVRTLRGKKQSFLVMQLMLLQLLRYLLERWEFV
uniref:ORF50a n=1 Tax=Pinus koraiensis TaxID=88728 RepID=A4QMH4_PINKO|nr:ORF50a [Pinus koraiensis]